MLTRSPGKVTRGCARDGRGSVCAPCAADDADAAAASEAGAAAGLSADDVADVADVAVDADGVAAVDDAADAPAPV
ncbi:MAG: hypothetical protein V4793_15155 [Paraburkholderia tropica]|uniref:hypothetical protein n=1 Tax=Paraburkholderia tropica TaxID=92647 RepID=UPI0015E8D566|nr:hypothetical protein [Paraburkholderia tropica]MDE1141042.1 hypothetical protein [Paraburkholderia tropica]